MDVDHNLQTFDAYSECQLCGSVVTKTISSPSNARNDDDIEETDGIEIPPYKSRGASSTWRPMSKTARIISNI